LANPTDRNGIELPREDQYQIATQAETHHRSPDRFLRLSQLILPKTIIFADRAFFPIFMVG
jgi:hypothetical protein